MPHRRPNTIRPRIPTANHNHMLILGVDEIPIGFLTVFLYPVVMIGFFIIWVYCMYKAYQHEHFKLPIIGNIVEGMVK